MPKNLPAKCYQEYKERLQENILEEEKQKLVEYRKNIIECEKISYYNYKKVFSFKNFCFFIRRSIKSF